MQAQLAHQSIGVTVSTRLATRPWAGDIEPTNTFIGDEPLRVAHRFLQRLHRGIDNHVRASEYPAAVDRARGAPTGTAERYDQRAIAVLDVLLRTLLVPPAYELDYRVPRRNHSVFSLPALRAPTSTGKAQVQRSIECTAINSRLTAGNHAGQPSDATMSYAAQLFFCPSRLNACVQWLLRNA